MRTFRSLATEEEYTRTQADFVAAIDEASTKRADQLLGVRGSQWVALVRYIESLELWFAHHQLDNRNWNGFGVGDPFGSRPVTPSIQINLAFAPRGPLLAARFIVDGDGRRWVTHRGKLGGNNGGTIAEFLAFYPKAETVRIDRTEHDLVLLGCIEEPDALIAAVADIAGAARAFREQRGDDGGDASPDDDE
jgi:hypothetical protein